MEKMLSYYDLRVRPGRGSGDNKEPSTVSVMFSLLYIKSLASTSFVPLRVISSVFLSGAGDEAHELDAGGV